MTWNRTLVPLVTLASGLACGSGGGTASECPVVWNGQVVVDCTPGLSNPKTGCPASGCLDPHAAGFIQGHGALACVEQGRLCSACHTTAASGPGALCASCHGPGKAPSPPCSF